MVGESEKSNDSKSNRIVPEPSEPSTAAISTQDNSTSSRTVYRNSQIRWQGFDFISAWVGAHDNLCDDSQVHWQWFKENLAVGTGQQEWINYTEFESNQIEERYQKGRTHIRLHSGKEESAKGNLKELFFGDMVQYNPISGKVRNIRRQGPDPISQKVCRWVRGYLRSIESGAIRHKSFLKYKKMLNQRAAVASSKPVQNQFCANIVHHGIFLLLQMASIILNTIAIGFDVEYNGIDATEGTRATFKAIDHAFCAFFTVEIILRFGALKKRATFCKSIRGILKDRWFTFDAILVLIMVAETWAVPIMVQVIQKDQQSEGLSQLSTLRILRLVRLSRVARVARLLKYFPETFMMVKSIVAAMRAVIATLGMLLVMLYIFAIIFKARCEGTAIQYLFPNIFGAMWRLLLDGSFMYELGDTVEAIFEVDAALAVVFMLFVFLSNLTVLNMLIGVICDVANDVSAKEKEGRSQKELTNDLTEFLECFDMDDDKTISMQEFDLLLNNPDVRSMLQRHDVDVEMVMALKKSLFTNKEAMAAARLDPTATHVDEPEWIEKKLSYDELVVVILRFRGQTGSHATMLDVTNLERNLGHRIWRLEHGIDRHHRSFTSVISQVKSMNSFKRNDSLQSLKTQTSQLFAGALGSEGPTSPKKMAGDDDPEITTTSKPEPESESSATNLEVGPEPDSESSATKMSGTHENQAKKEGVRDTNLSMMIPEETPWAKLKEELARQQSTFSAEINEQLKCLVAAQHEIGQFVRDSVASRVKDNDANERWPQPAKSSQAAIASNRSQTAAQDANVDPSGTGSNAGRRVDRTMNVTVDDEWGNTQMHVGSYTRPKAAPIRGGPHKDIPLLT